jgi:hypothetical protein
MALQPPREPVVEPGAISPLATGQTIFEGRLPDPTEAIRWGGAPGCEYAYVAADNYSKYSVDGWELADKVKPFTARGPRGICQFLVMVRGEPIVGADPLNGIRPWVYDDTILARTGIDKPFPTHPKEA